MHAGSTQFVCSWGPALFQGQGGATVLKCGTVRQQLANARWLCAILCRLSCACPASAAGVAAATAGGGHQGAGALAAGGRGAQGGPGGAAVSGGAGAGEAAPGAVHGGWPGCTGWLGRSMHCRGVHSEEQLGGGCPLTCCSGPSCMPSAGRPATQLQAPPLCATGHRLARGRGGHRRQPPRRPARGAGAPCGTAGGPAGAACTATGRAAAGARLHAQRPAAQQAAQRAAPRAGSLGHR